MLAIWIILLLLLPFIDLYILVQLADVIGFLSTLGLIILTGVIGAFILKREGRSVLQKTMTSVSAREVSRNILEAALLAVGGIMLLSPGIVTDLIGFTFVIRPTRERIMLYLADRLKSKSNVHFEVHQL